MYVNMVLGCSKYRNTKWNFIFKHHEVDEVDEIEKLELDIDEIKLTDEPEQINELN